MNFASIGIVPSVPARPLGLRNSAAYAPAAGGALGPLDRGAAVRDAADLRREPTGQPHRQLQPVETIVGTKMRLKNLGFYCGPVDDQRTERLRESIRMYQRERGLTPTGEMNDETARVLCAEHRS